MLAHPVRAHCGVQALCWYSLIHSLQKRRARARYRAQKLNIFVICLALKSETFSPPALFFGVMANSPFHL